MVKVVVAGEAGTSVKESQAWLRIKEAEIVGVADSLSSLREILQGTKVDIVDIGWVADSADPWVTLAAQAGKHILCADGTALGRDGISLCDQYDIVLQFANTLRFAPEYEQAQEQIKNGAVGKAGVIRLRRGAPPSSRNADKCIFQALGIGEFDWLRWTFGEVERVMAREVKHINESGQIVHYALVMLRMAGGAIAHVELSWAEETEHGSFELTGDQGMIAHDSRESTPIRWSRGEQFLSTTFLRMDLMQRQREHFVRCVQKQEVPRLHSRDLLAALDIASAARESVRTGQPVSLMLGGGEG
ncbi:MULTISPECIES: Gfo/Idh/MocA family protein [Brevibacillus]|uniref:Gfo/Idh/MocA family protein n=1 Tax=Brevibacillus TaxID=55080 RepID=UPI001E31FAEF|nr:MULTISPECIES: Gfo/Idh/MocA family oxidoreductase [Brevibacillus]MCE0451320.1 Gfo/Idh/MocA family oxidoreductase [Brevibacillus sp. AF8]UKK96716.1 Gfo/Idh/MocA family oxidoreductase [Brevibacillus brevis]